MICDDDDDTARRQGDSDLVLDIGYALAQSRVVVKGPRRIEECRAIAAAIVGYLRQCRWVWHRRPPPELHGDSTPKAKPASEPDRSP